MTKTTPQASPSAREDHDAGPGAPAGPARRPPTVSTGNPRIAVAFPFSKIDIREPGEAVRDIAVMLARLAAEVADLARHAPADGDGTADRLAAEAALLASRLGASS
jgi:hypothetical protein